MGTSSRRRPWKAYLNTAGSGLQSTETRNAVDSYLNLEGVIGSYFSEREYGHLLNVELYDAAARIFNCERESVAMFDSATRAWHAVVSALRLGPSDIVWTTPYEWAGNLFYLKNVQRIAGFTIKEIPLTLEGDIDVAWCYENLTDDVALISITHIPSCAGIVTPLADVSALVENRRAVLAVDACQSAGLVPIDLTATPVDLLTATGKKALLGPRGTGLAVVSEKLRDLAVPDSIDVHTHDFDPSGEIRPSMAGARRYELGEKCVSSFVGLKTALDQAATNDWEKIERHSAMLLDAARSIPGIEVYTAGRRTIGIISLNHRLLPAELLWDSLCDAEVASWLICGEHTPNFLLRQGVRRAVRLAVGPRTEQAEIEYAAGVLSDIAARTDTREPAWASS